MNDTPKGVIGAIWAEMEQEKGDLIERTEAYARWTIPGLLRADREEYMTHTAQTKGSVMMGAKWVNHLANRIVDVLFPLSRPFFTVQPTPKASREIDQEVGTDEAAVVREQIREATTRIEQEAIRSLRLVEYRPIAIEACKHLVVAGNVMLRRMPSGKRIIYTIDRYGIRRDIEGNSIEVVLFERKKLCTFTPDQQAMIKVVLPNAKDTDKLVLLSHYRKGADGRWVFKQEVEGIALGKQRKFTEKDFDLLPLVWNLPSGYHYATGLVEDNATTFHKVDVTTEALTDLIAIAADIKFFVRPGSPLGMQLRELNSAERGSYFAGNAEDISVPELKIRGDLDVIANIISKWESDLATVFLMSNVRDAERVTAEEIRLVASELESSFGGLYSQLALAWQQREADYAMGKMNLGQILGPLKDDFEVTVTTGLESLSREGQISNLRLAIGDLQMLDAVPDEMRSVFNAMRFTKFLFANRGVALVEFLNTPEEMQAQQEAALAQAGRQAEQQAGANVAEHAGKAAVDSQQ